MVIKLNEESACSTGKTDMTLYHFYRLVNNVDDRCYIGMTRRELRKRLHNHRYSTRCSSKQLIDQYGKDNIDIILIHSLEYETIHEAHREERRLIEEHRDRCVNLVIPYRSEDELKEQKKVQNKAWYEANKEEVKAQKKAYHETHKEKMNTLNKAYRETHKEEEKARNKVYHETHKEKRNTRRREARAKAKALISVPTVVEHVA